MQLIQLPDGQLAHIIVEGDDAEQLLTASGAIVAAQGDDDDAAETTAQQQQVVTAAPHGQQIKIIMQSGQPVVQIEEGDPGLMVSAATGRGLGESKLTGGGGFGEGV